MVKGFTDDKGKFRPTGNNGKSSSKTKSLDPEISEKLKMQGRKMNKQRRDEGFEMAGTKKFTINLREPIPSPSQVQGIIDKSFRDSRFAQDENQSGAEKEAYQKGFDRGIGIAESIITNLNDIPKGFHTEDIEELGFEFPPDEETVDSKDDLRSIVRQSAFDAESNDRQFSPFEFTAKEINDSMFDENGEQINDAFDAFDEGIAEGIDFVIQQSEILEVMV